MIYWQELLNILKGENIHFTARKSYIAEDVYICNDVPIFSICILSTRFVGHK